MHIISCAPLPLPRTILPPPATAMTATNAEDYDPPLHSPTNCFSDPLGIHAPLLGSQKFSLYGYRASCSSRDAFPPAAPSPDATTQHYNIIIYGLYAIPSHSVRAAPLYSFFSALLICFSSHTPCERHRPAATGRCSRCDVVFIVLSTGPSKGKLLSLCLIWFLMGPRVKFCITRNVTIYVQAKCVEFL